MNSSSPEPEPVPERVSRQNRMMVEDGIYYEEIRRVYLNGLITVVEWVELPMPDWLKEVYHVDDQ
jgi:hypothetical protein